MRDRESEPNEVKTPVRTVEDRDILAWVAREVIWGKRFPFRFFMNLRMQRVKNR